MGVLGVCRARVGVCGGAVAACQGPHHIRDLLFPRRRSLEHAVFLDSRSCLWRERAHLEGVVAPKCVCVCVQRVQRAALGGWWRRREAAAALRQTAVAVHAVRDRALRRTTLCCWRRAAATARVVRGSLGAWAAAADAGRVRRRRERFVVHRLATLRAGWALRAWATAVDDRQADAALVRRAVRRMYSTLSRSALREWSALRRRGRWTQWTLARWDQRRARGALAVGWWAWRQQISHEAWAAAAVARCRRRRVRLWAMDAWTRWVTLTARARALRAAYVRLYRRRARSALRAWGVAVELKAVKVERVDSTLARAASAMRTRVQVPLPP